MLSGEESWHSPASGCPEPSVLTRYNGEERRSRSTPHPSYLLLYMQAAPSTMPTAEVIARAMRPAHSPPHPEYQAMTMHCLLGHAYLLPVSPPPALLHSFGEHTGSYAGHRCRRCSHPSPLSSPHLQLQQPLAHQMSSLNRKSGLDLLEKPK